MAPSYPTYANIHTEPGTLDSNAWELWNKSGKGTDRIGALNLLTPAVILAAKDEIKAGISVQLDWSLSNLSFTIAGREPLNHKIIDYKDSLNLYVHDDTVNFNTQSGSQWDGFAHYADQKTGLYYNGVAHSEIGPSKNEQLGTHHWCENGGIVGRGVLLDYVGYLEAHKRPVPDPCTEHSITVDELDAVAAYQGVRWKDGDLLFIRSGFVRWYNGAADAERKERITGASAAFIGVKNGEEMKAWLWNHHFSAVAGDTLSFESYPLTEPALHEYLLPRWGMPIGEMFNLEGLAEACKQQKRWEFFFTSAPLNVPGGVASPPNAIAVL